GVCCEWSDPVLTESTVYEYDVCGWICVSEYIGCAQSVAAIWVPSRYTVYPATSASSFGSHDRSTRSAKTPAATRFDGGAGASVLMYDGSAAASSNTTSNERLFPLSPIWMAATGLEPRSAGLLRAGSAIPSTNTPIVLDAPTTFTWSWTSCQTPGPTDVGVWLVFVT